MSLSGQRRIAANWRWLAEMTGVAALYYGMARVGFLLMPPGANASPFWPPSGIGMAAVLILGPRIWPGIFIGAFLANALRLPPTLPGLVAAAAIGVGNTLQPIVGRLVL